MIPTPTGLTLISATPGVVVMAFLGAIGVDHYDMYRSTNPDQLGSKINVAPIAEPGGPDFTVTFTDDGIASTSAPDGPATYSYRAVAVDGAGNISLPSDSLDVPISVNQEPDFTPKQIHLRCVEQRGNS